MDPEHPLDVTKVLKGFGSATVHPATDVPATTSIIKESIESANAKQHIVPTESLSPAGRAVSKDVSELLSTTEDFLEEKNLDVLFQKIAARISEIAQLQSSNIAQTAVRKVFKETSGTAISIVRLVYDKRISENFLRVVKTFAVSTQFRQALVDFVQVLEQIILEGSDALVGTLEDVDVEAVASSGGGEASPSTAAEKSKAGGAKTFTEALREPSKRQQAIKESREPKESKEAKKETTAAAGATSSTSTASIARLDNESVQMLLQRFVAIVKQAQSNPDYQESLDQIVAQISALKTSAEQELDWEERLGQLTMPQQNVLREIRTKVVEMLYDLKQLFENLANTRLDDLLEAVSRFVAQISHDQEAIDTAGDLGSFLERCIRDKEYVGNFALVKADGAEIVQRVRQHLLLSYRPIFEHMLSKLRYYLDRLQHDPLNVKLTEDMSALTKHLFYDQQGNLTFKPELFGDLQKVFLGVLKQLRYIKIPDIVITEPGMFFAASDIVVNVSELAPNHLQLVVTSDVPEKPGQQKHKSLVKLNMTHMNAQANNINFSIDKHTMPALNDFGLVDFHTYGEGMKLEMELTPVMDAVAPVDPSSDVKTGLKVSKCECSLKHFEFNVHGSGHDWVYYLLRPFIRRVVKRRIEEGISEFFLSTDLTATLPVSSQTAV